MATSYLNDKALKHIVTYIKDNIGSSNFTLKDQSNSVLHTKSLTSSDILVAGNKLSLRFTNLGVFNISAGTQIKSVGESVLDTSFDFSTNAIKGRIKTDKMLFPSDSKLLVRPVDINLPKSFDFPDPQAVIKTPGGGNTSVSGTNPGNNNVDITNPVNPVIIGPVDPQGPTTFGHTDITNPDDPCPATGYFANIPIERLMGVLQPFNYVDLNGVVELNPNEVADPANIVEHDNCLRDNAKGCRWDYRTDARYRNTDQQLARDGHLSLNLYGATLIYPPIPHFDKYQNTGTYTEGTVSFWLNTNTMATYEDPTYGTVPLWRNLLVTICHNSGLSEASQYQSGDYSLVFQILGGRLMLHLFDEVLEHGVATRWSDTLINDGTWHHIVWRFNTDDTIDLFIDGALDMNVTFTDYNANANQLFMGKANTANNPHRFIWFMQDDAHVDGNLYPDHQIPANANDSNSNIYVDDPAFFDRALTDDEIGAISTVNMSSEMYRRFRLKINAGNDPSTVALKKIEMRSDFDEPLTLYWPIMSGSVDTLAGHISNLYLPLQEDGWEGTMNPANTWLFFQTPTDEVGFITEFDITATTESNKAPRDFEIQVSTDAVNWITVLEVTGETGWGSEETRTYNITYDSKINRGNP